MNKQGCGEVVLTGKGIPRRCKLTCEQVAEIKHLRKTTDLNLKEIASMFGMTAAGIGNIVNGISYNHCRCK
jgi:hypothetical protein